VATNPTPGPSDPRHNGAAETHDDNTPETTTTPKPSKTHVTPADLIAATRGARGLVTTHTAEKSTDDDATADQASADRAPAAANDDADMSSGDQATSAAGEDSGQASGDQATSAASRSADQPDSGSDDASGTTAAAPAVESAEAAASDEWGRVDVNGEVYLRTAEGERHIGSWQVGEPDKALAFYRRKFDDLVVQVDLLEQRLLSGAASPDSTDQAVVKLREALTEPHAIGDLDTLRGRLNALKEQVSERRAERKAARAQELDEARARKENIAGEAEAIAEGNDWRHGADRLRHLLDEWKSLPRLDRATDDALWRRFSTARTHYTRRRKAHFAELADRRETAREAKEEILAEAEELADSTDWGDTARRFRDLMSRWKSAGPAPRAVDEALWKRFRAAQDTFFEARSATFEQRDSEQQSNLESKEALLLEAEALLPVTNWKAARATLRSVQDRWEAVGHVPRESMKSVESRLRRVEEAIRAAEESDWERTNPEARARAEDTVAQLRSSISDLEAQASKAREAGNERKSSEAEESLAARRAWLEQAEQALDDFR
jgi:hypothetical protein